MLKLGNKKVDMYLGDRAVKKAFLGEKLVYERDSLAHIPENLNDCSWDMISYLSQNDLFKDYYQEGDTKSILLNGPIGGAFIANNLPIDLVVVGINHNPEREGEHLVHFLLGKVGNSNVGLIDNQYFESFNVESNYFVINAQGTNNGGYQSCQLRKNVICGNGTPLNPIESTLMAALPLDLRAVMRPATKWTDNVGGGSNSSSVITSTTEYVCLIDEYEHLGTVNYANVSVSGSNYQKQYNYFKSVSNKRFYAYKDDGSISSNAYIYYRGPCPYNFSQYWDGTTGNGETPDFVSGNYSRGIPALIFV